MTIILYNNKSNPRQVNKSLTQIASITGYLKAGSSIIDPVLERVTMGSTPVTANYMEIPEFGRKYFITDIAADDTNGLWRISGHVDVLGTYWDQVKDHGAVIRRQTNQVNLYLPDPMFPLQARRSAEIMTFPKGFTASQAGACCVLTIIGATTS